LLGDPQLGRVRTLIGDPAGIDGGHENAVLLEHFGSAGAGEHVECGLGDVGVRSLQRERHSGQAPP
jgi:hypothetical protein